MTDFPNGTVFKYTMNFISQGLNLSQLVGHVQYVGGGLIADTDVLDDFETVAGAFANLWVDIANQQCQLASIKVSESTLSGDLPVGERIINVLGSLGTDHVANGVAAITRSPVPLSKGQLRKFLPGLDDAVIVQGILTALGLARAITIGDLLFNQWNTLVLLGLVGVYDPGSFEPLRTVPFLKASGDVLVNAIVGYQRRRKPGVGA